MDSTMAELVDGRLKPLGGRYHDRYWPVGEDDVEQIEATVGFALPRDYREFILTVGLAAPAGHLAVSPEGLEHEISLSVLYGKDRLGSEYSVVDLAGLYLVPTPLLKIGQSHQGALFIDQGGAVLYENNNEAGLTQIAPSFFAFLSSLEVVGDPEPGRH